MIVLKLHGYKDEEKIFLYEMFTKAKNELCTSPKLCEMCGKKRLCESLNRSILLLEKHIEHTEYFYDLMLKYCGNPS